MNEENAKLPDGIHIIRNDGVASAENTIQIGMDNRVVLDGNAVLENVDLPPGIQVTKREGAIETLEMSVRVKRIYCVKKGCKNYGDRRHAGLCSECRKRE